MIFFQLKAAIYRTAPLSGMRIGTLVLATLLWFSILLTGGCTREAICIDTGVQTPHWLPDGTAIIYPKRTRTGWELRRYAIATHKITRYPKATISEPFAVSQDGTAVAYGMDKDGIFVHTLATGVTTRVFVPADVTSLYHLNCIAWLDPDTLFITVINYAKPPQFGLLHLKKGEIEFFPIQINGPEFRYQPDASGFTYLGKDGQYHYYDVLARTDQTLVGGDHQQLMPLLLLGSKVLVSTNNQIIWYDRKTGAFSSSLPVMPRLYAGALSPDRSHYVSTRVYGNGDPSLISRSNELLLEKVPVGLLPTE